MKRPPQERAEFLAKACANDPELHREVESLLAYEGRADELLETPAWNHVTPPDESSPMAPAALAAGSVLAAYRIVGKLGAGGMGEIYRAADSKLQREVALKVLAPGFAHDREWLSRFQREARVLASINHPHIAAIYGLEESSGVCAIAMELVEGPTLAERIKRRQIPVKEALAIARQIAEALEYAHEKGIVHRDLKPANVKLRPDGVVKVLDFGLAKAVEANVDPNAINTNETPAATATRVGIIVGTPAYMAPEQAAGLPVDRRADIWAFGVVLFEMLSSRQIYARKTTLETLAAVARDQPRWGELPAETPAAILRLLRRCLDKDPKRRLRDIGEARIALEEDRPDEIAGTSGPARRWRARAGWIAAGLLAVAFTVLAIFHFRETRMEARAVRFVVFPPEDTTLNPKAAVMAMAPAGRRLVFNATSADGKVRLWLRALDSLAALPLAGTEGANLCFWSPDSRFLAFFAEGKLKKIDLDGTSGPAPPVTLCDAPNSDSGAWSRDGVILFSHLGVLYRVADSGGPATPATRLDVAKQEAAHRNPWFLPDGRHFLFEVIKPPLPAEQVTIRAGSLDSPESKLVVEADSNAIYAQGQLLFLRGETLMAQPFDPRRLLVTGDAVSVAAGLPLNSAVRLGAFSASENGLLVFWAGARLNTNQLVWFDRGGKRLSTVGEPGDFFHPDFSPDRKAIAVSVKEQGNHDIWLYDLARGLRTRFTFDPAREDSAVWSPDGRAILFNSDRKGHFDLYSRPSDGSGPEELLYADNCEKHPTDYSPDGRFLLYFASCDAKTGSDLWVLPLKPEQPGAPLKPFPFLQTPAMEVDGQFSPDGRWIAYQSNESGRDEIYAAPFRRPGGIQGVKRQVSAAGARFVRWARDGKEIFYLAASGMFTAAEVSITGDALEIGARRPLFGPLVLGGRVPFDVSADGQRFLISIATEQHTVEPLTVVENWTAGLKRPR